jgi:tripartite-type tricarboxylate transporter receptor subunit TctC
MNTNMPSRRSILRGGCVALTGWLAAAAGEHTYAQAAAEQLRILCSGPAGSIPDIIARRVGEQLTGRSTYSAIVENRPGAAGQIAVGALKSASSSSSTVLLAQGAIATVYPFLYAKLAYDPVADLRPVSLAGEMTLGLAVGPAVPARIENVRELAEWMRRNPKLANVGSPGTGTLPHLLEVMLFQEGGVAWQHIVYAGGPPAIVDLLGGQIAALVLPEGLLRQHAAAGRLRVLATSGAQRSAYMPEVATLVEQGYRNLVVGEWFAFFMSAGASASSIESISAAIRSALVRPEVAAAFAESGMTATSSTPSGLASRIAAEQRYWEPIIRSAGIRAD